MHFHRAIDMQIDENSFRRLQMEELLNITAIDLHANLERIILQGHTIDHVIRVSEFSYPSMNGVSQANWLVIYSEVRDA